MANRPPVSQMLNINLDLLDPDPQNAKEHTPVQIDQIVASIHSYGFNDPLGVIPTSNGRYMIVEGHGRSEAAKRIGMTEVPCLILPTMTANERKAYAIAHNQIQTITGLDMDVIGAEFDRFNVGEDDHLSVGFTSEDVLFLLPDPDVVANGSDGVLRPDEENDDPDSGYTSESWKGFIPPVHKTTLHFNTEGDQLAFFQFVQVLRGRYLTAATIAERFVLFLEEYAPETEETTDADV